jgi:hypothetical protein
MLRRSETRRAGSGGAFSLTPARRAGCSWHVPSAACADALLPVPALPALSSPRANPAPARRWVGTFTTAAEAARAYDAAALALHGSSTCTNFHYPAALLARYPAWVPKNDPAAVAALQAVIDGEAELPEPDDPLYTEAVEAGLAAAAAQGHAHPLAPRGRASSCSGGGSAAAAAAAAAAAGAQAAHGPHMPPPGAAPHAAIVPIGGGAAAAAASAVAAAAAVAAADDHHGMPFSVPPVRTLSVDKVAALRLRQLLESSGSPLHSSRSPDHSSAVRFQLPDGSGSAGSPALLRRRAHGLDESGHSSDGTPKGPQGYAGAAAEAGPRLPLCGPRAGSPFPLAVTGEGASSLCPADVLTHSGGLVFPGRLSERDESAGGAGGGAGDCETPHFGRGGEPRGSASGSPAAADRTAVVVADVGTAGHGAAQEERSPAQPSQAGWTCSEGGCAPSSHDLLASRQQAAAAVADAGKATDDETMAQLFAGADAGSKLALLQALLARQRGEEAAAAAARRADAEAAARREAEVQQRNAETLSSLKQLMAAAGPGATAAMLPALTKLPAVQLLLRSIHAHAPGLVASVAAEQRAAAAAAAEQQRRAAAAEAAHRRQLLAQLLMVQGARQASAHAGAAAPAPPGGDPAMLQRLLNASAAALQQAPQSAVQTAPVELFKLPAPPGAAPGAAPAPPAPAAAAPAAPEGGPQSTAARAELQLLLQQRLPLQCQSSRDPEPWAAPHPGERMPAPKRPRLEAAAGVAQAGAADGRTILIPGLPMLAATPAVGGTLDALAAAAAYLGRA